ncbi:hypothetical protein GZ77_08375 [Endozoicomonas montiporae]|uniref:Multidrug resistance protein MdtA-like barrel-sandwich hybrid domain-containing protein n=2 Tax=Endozoicomonas montiporae TaxID=1027273 RepID=A0A081N7G4_9GAMM|nr:efflux RND transporter periplasmic adaptor subunit [Endozoicomonas montiporae]AMO55771.1 membrane-fusion protein [Endozoicomonas montiporae CL-33]KEQ14387.1 hypothetical protein GZ77_08375 [Endozoicomonas montiporae]
MASSNARRQLFISLAVLAICAGIGFGLTKLSKPPEEEKQITTIPLVESRVLATESVRFSINSQGVVHPAIETTLVTQVSGLITEVAPVFVSGGVFQKGDLLVRIDDSDYRVAVRQAEASLAASEARLTEETARSKAEKQSWLRSGRKLEDAPELLLREPYVAEARAQVKAAGAQLDKALRDLERTVIRAPYDGMVRERMVNLGQFLGTGAQLGMVFSVGSSEVRLPLKPADLAFIDLPAAGRQVSSDIQVSLSQSLGGQTVTWEADLVRVEGTVDEKSRMHYVVARVTDPYALNPAKGNDSQNPEPLKAGSFVTARLQGGEVEGLFQIPRRAVYADGKVMVIDDNNSLRYRTIQPVYADENKVYVSHGLIAGERLCLTPLTNPVEGMKVRLSSNATKSINNNG